MFTFLGLDSGILFVLLTLNFTQHCCQFFLASFLVLLLSLLSKMFKKYIYSREYFKMYWNVYICVCQYIYLFISVIVSRQYPENPVIWLVLGAGSIFLSPDHSHGNQLPCMLRAEWSCELLKEGSFKTWQKNIDKNKRQTMTKPWLFQFLLIVSPTF